MTAHPHIDSNTGRFVSFSYRSVGLPSIVCANTLWPVLALRLSCQQVRSRLVLRLLLPAASRSCRVGPSIRSPPVPPYLATDLTFWEFDKGESCHPP